MEEDFQHHTTLGDDIFDALNSSDTELTGEKKLTKTIHELYGAPELKTESQPFVGYPPVEPNPGQPSYKQSEIMFPRMPILNDDLNYEPKKTANAMDEFLSFNNPNTGKADKMDENGHETADFKMGDDSYLNMVSMLNDNYPKIDLNGMSVDKPVDVVVGLPDHFVIRNYNMTDKIDNEKNDILNENRYGNDFILSDNDFLANSNLLTGKQMITEPRTFEGNSNLMGDHVLNLDFSNSQMYINRNFPTYKVGNGRNGENVGEYNFGNPTTLSLNYEDNSYCFMEDREKNYATFDTTGKSIEENKSQNQELSYEESGNGLSDINLNLTKNDAYVKEEEKFSSSMKQLKRLKLEPKRNSNGLIDEEEDYKGFDFKYQNKRMVDCNKENNLHYVRYQHLGDRSIKIWQCGVCGKDFRHQYTLTRHLPTHTDERNYKCETCGKAFRQMSTLSQHRAIHSDARPYVCEFCRKTFNRVSTLISHKKTHSDYKPHKCHICGKAFHQKGNLRNHIFTHTNERPYKCDICTKGFNQMSNLMCHKAHTHSEKGMYPCIRCGQVFNKRFSLRNHEEYVHGIKYPSRDVNNDEKKSLRVVHLPNENRTNIEQFDKTEKVSQPNKSPLQRLKITKTYITDRGVVTEKSMCVGIVIDLIKTKAMETAIQNGQTPFALFKPSSGIPVLVKVLNANCDTQHMLVPATPDDLKVAGKITVAPNSETTSVKTVQIKVPVVATVIQTFDEMGKMRIDVEPPGPELENQNNELHKNSKKNVMYKVEPEIFCEPMECESENNQEFPQPAETGNVQLLSLDEAKKIFNSTASIEMYGEVGQGNNGGTDFGTFGTVMTYMRGTGGPDYPDAHVSAGNPDGEMFLVPGDEAKNPAEAEISEILS
ncbi:hypothetical protein RUM44_001565 [Polyplax serrata]|uniref:C2H2-type domain-containing protein n=1 Tax=Polyplax serrata TaxID=468196 RepID=A0ABR1AKE3_POLSC